MEFGEEYFVTEKPVREWVGSIFCSAYNFKEYKDIVIAWPRTLTGKVVFIIDKMVEPRWRSQLPRYGATLFPRIRVPWLTVAVVGSNGGLFLPEAMAGTQHRLVMDQNREIYLVSEVELPPLSYVEWEILPPGEIAVGKGDGDGGSEEPDEMVRIERLTILAMLEPSRWWRGRLHGPTGVLRSREYMVAEFDAEHVVIADSVWYGNALYWTNTCEHPNWMVSLEQPKSRIVKLGFHKIVHVGEWTTRLKEALGRIK